jgi:hypothetical protein
LFLTAKRTLDRGSIDDGNAPKTDISWLASLAQRLEIRLPSLSPLVCRWDEHEPRRPAKARM